MILNKKCMEIVNTVINAGNCNHLSRLDCMQLVDQKTIDSVILPILLFWDPLEQPCKTFICPLCHQDGNPNSRLHRPQTLFDSWEAGSSNSMMPRKIWDVNWFIALVGRRYHRMNSHSVSSYHAGILRQMNPAEVPFILSHDSGLTMEAFDLVNRLVDHGNSFSVTQKIFTEGIIDKYHRRNAFFLPNKYEFNEITDEAITRPPSEQFLRGCFLYNYNMYKKVYNEKMQSINCEYLSCDHTFKVATNIGYLDQNKKWVKVVDSLFLFMNEKGQILGYKMCKGTSFNLVEDIFKDLSVRNPHITHIYLDNCCTWKHKLAEFFPNAIVKLDLFHAVQRLVKTISKRHPYCQDMCKELTLVFRDINDTGDERSKPTPPPNQIIKNMETFLTTWENVEFKGWKVLTSKFLKHWDNLKVHVDLGCLSGIPVGHGTNKNENLHRQMRILLPRNRLGVDTAEALFNSLFYYHNERKKTKIGTKGQQVNIKHVWPIWQFAKEEHHFGISDAPVNNNIDFDEPFLIDSLYMHDDEDIPCEHADHNGYNVKESISGRTRRIIAIAKQFKEIQAKMNSDLLYRLFGTNGFASLPADVWQPMEYLQAQEIDNNFPIDSIMQTLGLAQMRHSGPFVDTIAQQLSDMLRYTDVSSKYQSFLERSGIRKDSPTETIISNLFSIIEDELQFNEDDYEVYCEDKTQSHPEALANSLGIMIVLVPACFGMPFLPIAPRQGLAIQNTFYVWCGPNKTQFTSLISMVTGPTKTSCRCGRRSKKEDSSHCQYNDNCSCLTRGIKCGKSCFCKRCQNGRPETFSSKRRRRIQPCLSQTSTLTSFSAARV
ncbi:uncharacterized protein [Clytia hemisphaerica]|uniref:uncharacterized protein n=1 Tax=Clytia hemisphaerica TaxID=252671 RepID=UPI0034D4A18B